jgi:hypothetical protein
MFVSKNAKSFYDAQFVGQRVIKTRAEVIAMGFDKKLVDKLPSYSDGMYNQEHTERELYQTESPETEYQSIDKSTDYVRIVECYTKIDYEKKGKPTLRKITMGGNESVILDNEEIDYLPFSMVTPIPMPHLFLRNECCRLSDGFTINEINCPTSNNGQYVFAKQRKTFSY